MVDATNQWQDEILKFIKRRINISVLESELRRSQASFGKVNKSSSKVCLALSKYKFCKSDNTAHANVNVAAVEKESVSKSFNVKGGSTVLLNIAFSAPNQRIGFTIAIHLLQCRLKRDVSLHVAVI